MATQSGRWFSAWPSAARLLEESTVLITSFMLFIAYVIMVLKPVHFLWHAMFVSTPLLRQRLCKEWLLLLCFCWLSAVETELPDPKRCPCQHGGTCVQENKSDNITCVCPKGIAWLFYEQSNLLTFCTMSRIGRMWQVQVVLMWFNKQIKTLGLNTLHLVVASPVSYTHLTLPTTAEV